MIRSSTTRTTTTTTARIGSSSRPTEPRLTDAVTSARKIRDKPPEERSMSQRVEPWMVDGVVGGERQRCQVFRTFSDLLREPAAVPGARKVAPFYEPGRICPGDEARRLMADTGCPEHEPDPGSGALPGRGGGRVAWLYPLRTVAPVKKALYSPLALEQRLRQMPAMARST